MQTVKTDLAAELARSLEAMIGGEQGPVERTLHQHVAYTLDLLETVAEPFSAATTTPGHVTACAYVVDPVRRALLQIWHPKLERWLAPGGHYEAADGLLHLAARRELAEETGIVDLESFGPAPLDVDIHYYPAKGATPEHYHFDLRFGFWWNAQAPRTGEHEGLIERWQPLAAIASDPDPSWGRIGRRLLMLCDEANEAGAWYCCSPELLNAGLSCHSAPRRPGGERCSHEHWVPKDILARLGRQR